MTFEVELHSMGQDKANREFPGRLRHGVPDWVDRENAVYHIRIRVMSGTPSLIEPSVALAILGAGRKYGELGWWWPKIFLLMPDHLHLITAFHPDKPIARIIGDWKAYQARTLGITWQDNFFDHRFRSTGSMEEKFHYIRMNPVRAQLCDTAEDWPWSFMSCDP